MRWKGGKWGWVCEAIQRWRKVIDMSVKDAREALEATSPTFGVFASAIGAILFWLFLPVTFLIGAAWAGVVAGFKLGRDW